MKNLTFSKRKFTVKLLLSIIIINSVMMMLQPVSGSTATMEKVSDILDGNTNDVFVLGTAAYVACGWGGLKVYDISDPNDIFLADELDGIGEITSISIKDGFAFLTEGESGLIVVDITDTLEVVGALTEPGNNDFAIEVETSGNYALFSDWEDGVEIVDISNPYDLSSLPGYNRISFSVTDLCINGSYVYVNNLASNINRMEIIDISDFANPVLRGSYSDGNGIPVDITTDGGDLVYLADYDDGLEIINVSDPQNPMEIGNYSAPEVVSVYINGSYAYIVSSNGFEILDVSDPTNPIQMSVVECVGDEQFFVDPFIYLSSPWHDGITILDVSNSSDPTIIGVINNEMYVEAITVEDYSVYCAGSDGISAISALYPESPVAFANYTEIENVPSLDSSGDYLYSSNHSEFLVINRFSMLKVGSYNHSSDIVGIEVDGSIAVLGCHNGTDSSYAIVDITNPTSPALYSEYILSEGNVQLVGGTVRGDLLLLLVRNIYSSDTMLIPVDISVPTHPTEITRFECGRFGENICVEGNYAYVTSFREGIRVIDITMPGAPEIVGEYTYPLSINTYDFYLGIEIQGDFLYVGVYTGVLILDVYDKTAPEFVSFFEDETLVELVEVSGDYVYYSTGQDGVEILKTEISPSNRRRIPGYSTLILTVTSISVVLYLINIIKRKQTH